MLIIGACAFSYCKIVTAIYPYNWHNASGVNIVIIDCAPGSELVQNDMWYYWGYYWGSS